jgi:hypothetical protein
MDAALAADDALMATPTFTDPAAYAAAHQSAASRSTATDARTTQV